VKSAYAKSKEKPTGSPAGRAVLRNSSLGGKNGIKKPKHGGRRGEKSHENCGRYAK